MDRKAACERKTKETDISLSLNIDGSGRTKIDTGIGFFDHMLDGFARHGLFDLEIKVTGDLGVDCHHTIEDTGIVLGQAVREALGNKAGIRRYGHSILPMDETLILSAVDISGRSMLRYTASIPTEKVGTFDTELAEEFWTAFARCAGITLHIRQLDGTNSHHTIEGMFKSVARSLRAAVAIDQDFRDEIPSTKGVLG